MLKDKTYQLQSAMSDYVRKGEKVDLPVDSEMRLGQYRRLVFNVVKGTLDQAYPIAARHLGKEVWFDLIHDFFANHSCQHPQVWRMPRELMDFVSDQNYSEKLDLPHLPDLLRMEWLEIEVHSMPDLEIKPFGKVDDLMSTPLYFNPHFRLEKFDYPVHKIHECNPAEKPGEYFILIFREEETGRVQFNYLDSINAVMLDSMVENPGTSATEILHAVCESAGIPHSDSLRVNLAAMLKHLYDKKFILGSAIL